jgi:hypothetical protein
MAEQLVNLQIAVRPSDVPKVYAFLHSLDGDEGADDYVEGEEWSKADLRELAHGRQESLLRVSRMMDVLAASPGQKLALSELAAATGYTAGELQGGLSGLTRWINNKWDTGGWPFLVQQGESKTAGRSSESHYWMHKATAARWKSIREEQND